MFDDIKTQDGLVILESSEIGLATAEESVVLKRIDERENQVGKWLEYINKWEKEGRI